MKKRNNLVKKIAAIAFIFVFALIALATTVCAESRADYLKRRANEAADIFREMGYDENSAAIRICQLMWQSADGRITNGTYLHDATNDQKYYLLSPNNYNSYDSYNGYSGKGYYGDEYYDGQYYWYYSDQKLEYYRYNKDGGQVWRNQDRSAKNYREGNTGTVTYKDLTNGNKFITSGYNTYTTLGQNIKDYNYTYSGVNLYAGRIYGLECSNMNEVDTLAHIINSYIPDADLVGKASFGWSILDLGNGIPTQAVQYYSYYDPNSYNDWDMQEFCKELLFRYYAEQKGGNQYVGRILPEGYGYIHAQNSYQAEFSQSKNGSAYTYPDLYSTRKSKYHSPY